MAIRSGLGLILTQVMSDQQCICCLFGAISYDIQLDRAVSLRPAANFGWFDLHNFLQSMAIRSGLDWILTRVMSGQQYIYCQFGATQCDTQIDRAFVTICFQLLRILHDYSQTNSTEYSTPVKVYFV